MTGSSWQPVSVKKPDKAMGEPRRESQMVENHTQDGCFKRQFEKMEVLQFFSVLNQAFSFGIVVWDSKLLRHSNCSELGLF